MDTKCTAACLQDGKHTPYHMLLRSPDTLPLVLHQQCGLPNIFTTSTTQIPSCRQHTNAAFPVQGIWELTAIGEDHEREEHDEDIPEELGCTVPKHMI
jgi:hypothetical protein